MKTELVILLILDVLKSTKTEFRHHQQERYARENITVHPWSLTTLYKLSKDTRATDKASLRQQWTVTVPDEGGLSVSAKSKAFRNFFKASKNDVSKSIDANESTLNGETRKSKNDSEAGSFIRQDDVTRKKSTNEFSREGSPRRRGDSSDINIVEATGRSSIVHVTDETHSLGDNLFEETSTETRFEDENTAEENFARETASFEKVGNSDEYNNLYREVFDFHFAEPLVALSDESDGCVENVVENFVVTDDVVSEDILTERDEAKKLAIVLATTNDGLDKSRNAMDTIMKNHPRILILAVAALKAGERSKATQMIYRKGDALLINDSPGQTLILSAGGKNSWTGIFKSCLTKTWIFGYSASEENENVRIDVTIYYSVDNINGTVDQCNSSFRHILNGGPKCDTTSTKCVMAPNSGFAIGGYRCVCREGFYFPKSFPQDDQYISGHDVEKTSGNSSRFKCLPCRDSTCAPSCAFADSCEYQRTNLLRQSVLFIQVICVLTTAALTVIIFRHRKCKTIATGMWTIMEMILLGSIILYSTIIIRAFSPSTILCLIEPWCREIGFVLCYGAIILKLYRILIEFRTRKAHRWVIRDKDLLKYLLGMVIVVFGYMSAWTAVNLDLIQKQNYSMLTTGITADGIFFRTCKTAWWDYVTQTCELLILIFGIHISYASRNATTQFRERCFLCISITIEALVSGIFYVLRYFYWEAAVHPDTSFLADFTRCHLTTTVVLSLLFAPKWWYQKVQANKGRVSRNYLMQESGRGPLEAYKPQVGVTATNSDVECEISLADMNPEDIRAELKRLYTQLEVLKNKTIRFDNPHISKRRGGRKIAHRRFSLQKKGSREKTLRQQTQRLSARHTEIEITEAEASRTPEDSVCSNEGPSIVINDGPSDIVHATPRKGQK